MFNNDCIIGSTGRCSDATFLPIFTFGDVELKRFPLNGFGFWKNSCEEEVTMSH